MLLRMRKAAEREESFPICGFFSRSTARAPEKAGRDAEIVLELTVKSGTVAEAAGRCDLNDLTVRAVKKFGCTLHSEVGQILLEAFSGQGPHRIDDLLLGHAHVCRDGSGIELRIRKTAADLLQNPFLMIAFFDLFLLLQRIENPPDQKSEISDIALDRKIRIILIVLCFGNMNAALAGSVFQDEPDYIEQFVRIAAGGLFRHLVKQLKCTFLVFAENTLVHPFVPEPEYRICVSGSLLINRNAGLRRQCPLRLPDRQIQISDGRTFGTDAASDGSLALQVHLMDELRQSDPIRIISPKQKAGWAFVSSSRSSRRCFTEGSCQKKRRAN